jgi:hypothetical protein
MTPQIVQTRQGMQTAWDMLGAQKLRHAAKDNGFINVSQFLESLDPSDAKERHVGEDAWTRLLMAADVRVASDPYGGYYAHTAARLMEPGTRDLFGEWARRAFVAGTSTELRRRAAEQRANAEYLSTDFAAGTIQRPYDDDRTLRAQQTEPAIPLASVISRSRTNQGQDYRSRYLTKPVAGDVRMLRVAELTELPAATLTESSRAIRLSKFGRKLVASYELLRRTQLDDLQEHIRQLAIQTEVDQVTAAVDVMINGDGNAGTSGVVYNLTTLDPATTSGNLTLLAWLAFRLKWANPYGPTAVLGRAAEMLKVLTLTLGNANTLTTSAGLASIQQELRPMNNRLADGLLYGITDDAPANRLVGFDGRFAVERVVETGSEIAEVDRFITRQAEEMTFSFNEGYAVIDAEAVKILRLDA